MSLVILDSGSIYHALLYLKVILFALGGWRMFALSVHILDKNSIACGNFWTINRESTSTSAEIGNHSCKSFVTGLLVCCSNLKLGASGILWLLCIKYRRFIVWRADLIMIDICYIGLDKEFLFCILGILTNQWLMSLVQSLS